MAVPKHLRADSGIYKGFVVVDKGDGYGNTFYNLSGGEPVSNFNGLNLGNFDAASGMLKLNGFEVDTFKNGSSNVTGAFGDYRVYPTGGATPSFTEAGVPFNADNVDGTPGNQRWQSTGQNTNILAGPLDVGTYTFEVYERASTNEGDKYLTNGGSNYKASFTIGISNFSYSSTTGSGSTSTATNWSTGRAPGNGHNLSFDSTVTSAVTNTLTSANQIAFGSSAGAFTISGGTLSVASTIINPSASNQTISTSLSGAASLTQLGSGSLTLSGTNAYTGTTAISAGTLIVNGNQSAATGNVGVASGGTLGGTGTIGGATTVASGGTITGNTNGTVGTLNLTAGLTINGTYVADIVASGGSDKLAVTGILNVTGGALSLIYTGTLSATQYVLATYTSLTSTFGTNISFNGNPGVPAGYQVDYVNGVIALDVIPEPGTWLGGLFLCGAVGYTQRRRFQGLRIFGAFR